MQFKEKLMSQNEENVKNLILGPILTHLAQIEAPIFFFFGIFTFTRSCTLLQAIILGNFKKN